MRLIYGYAWRLKKVRTCLCGEIQRAAACGIGSMRESKVGLKVVQVSASVIATTKYAPFRLVLRL